MEIQTFMKYSSNYICNKQNCKKKKKSRKKYIYIYIYIVGSS